MPETKKSLIRRLIKEALKEAELSIGEDNTTFSIKVDIGNPQSETKLGIRIKLKPKDGFLDFDKKGQLEAAIMKKFNNSLEQFNLQISLDTDTQDPEAMGFFIPLPQIKNMIVTAIGGSSTDEPKDKISSPSSPTSFNEEIVVVNEVAVPDLVLLSVTHVVDVDDINSPYISGTAKPLTPDLRDFCFITSLS